MNKAEIYSKLMPISSNNKVIKGTAALYYNGTPGSEFPIADNYVVRFSKGSLKLQDTVFAYLGHDTGKPLAKTPDSLKLSLDDQGLHFEAQLPDTSYARDLQALIESGVVQGCSFGCYPVTTRMAKEGQTDVRWIDEAQVFEISPTHNPAFGGTEVALLERDKFHASSLEENEKKLAVLLNSIKS